MIVSPPRYCGRAAQLMRTRYLVETLRAGPRRASDPSPTGSPTEREAPAYRGEWTASPRAEANGSFGGAGAGGGGGGGRSQPNSPVDAAAAAAADTGSPNGSESMSLNLSVSPTPSKITSPKRRNSSDIGRTVSGPGTVGAGTVGAGTVGAGTVDGTVAGTVHTLSTVMPMPPGPDSASPPRSTGSLSGRSRSAATIVMDRSGGSGGVDGDGATIPATQTDGTPLADTARHFMMCQSTLFIARHVIA